MKKQRVFVTGATGGMGFSSLKEMLKDTDKQDIVILARDSEKNRKLLAPYMQTKGLSIEWGDLNDYQVVKKCVKGCDIVLHIAAFVSPAADYYPDRAMKVNYGSTKNIINAIYDCGQENSTRLVYIGTVAETGDRMPPIHWGRVGDPIKPSMFDYYAVSKVAAERLVIESGLKYWVSLRQTGIIGKAMSDATGKRVEAMVYGDGAFKDPAGKIWELADPVVAPGYTSGLVGTPNELKLKYLADKEFADLSGEELKNAISEKIKAKDAKQSLVGNMVSEGTTPRNLTDLIGSLCDLTSGSGDKGTPIVYIQGYFDNYTNE